MFSKIFINRPKFALVISIVIALSGAICLFKLPIAEYPEIAPPTIMVRASYPGASSQVVAETVASIIEEQVNGIENMVYFKSESDNNGNYTLLLTFESGCNSDIAQVNVQNAVQRAESKLPDEVRALGIVTTKRSTDMVGVYVFTTDGTKLSDLELANYVRMNVKDPFSRIPGISYAEILGERNYSMRIWLDPTKMAALNLTPELIAAKVRSQNIQAAAGSVGAEKSNRFLQLKIDTRGRLTDPEQFRSIVVVSDSDGRQVTLGDLARLELGSETYADNGYWGGKPSVALAIYRQDGANAIALIDSANKLLTELKERMPEGVDAFLGYDPTDYIRTSIEEIAYTLLLTLILVVAITYVFLQDWRATLIPSVAIPVSLLGTFVVMLMLGYSVNVLTMFGLILVIGSLVDDAIVVVENCMRLIEDEKLSPREAALKSMGQITSAIIATTLVTVAIYAPIGFYGGMVGTIYKQFAVTMCTALCFSAVVALTLSPALCALILRPVDKLRRKSVVFRGFDGMLNLTKLGYIGCSRFMVRRAYLTLLLMLMVLGCNYLVVTNIFSGFLPDEDKGALLCEVELPPGASLYRTDEALRDFTDKVLKLPGVKSTITVSGFSLISGLGENVGAAIVILKDWSERNTPDKAIAALRGKVMEIGASIPSAKIMAFQPPAIMGLGATGGVSFDFQTTGNLTPKEFEAQVFKLLGMLNDKKAMPELAYAFSSYNAGTPQVYLEIDRAKAEALGVPVSRIFRTLQSILASEYVNDFNLYGYSFKVKLQVDSTDRANLNNLEQIMIRNDGGEMVPLSAVATLRYVVGARKLERFNQNMAAAVTGIAAPGVASGAIMRKIEDMVKTNFSKENLISWTDMSHQERGNEGKIGMLMTLAVIFGYLFLVAQYESWTTPLPVIVSVAFATLGGLLGLYWMGYALDIYAQLGLIMLIGLSCKSAILMVEFSAQERASGRTIADAAINGANHRYRAVLMTAWSFIVGVFPLVFATGAGAASRRVIGVTTCYGMLMATIIGVAFIPPLYSFFQSIRERVKKPQA